jgi:hypothetical protein
MAEKHLTASPAAGSIPCTNPCATPYHQEEIAEYGAAAVMRMVLGSQRVGLNPLPTQADLYNDAVTRNSAGEPANLWHVDPQGLRDSLIHFKPASFTNTFVNYNFDGTPLGLGQANAKLIYTINQYEVAPAALVAGGPQWLAVVGYRTDNSDALTAVFLNDPRPPVAQGTGDPPDWEVSAATWSGNNAYFRPVNNLSTTWGGKYATVCDPDKPEGETLIARDRPMADGRELINPEQAIEIARRLLEERGTIQLKTFARALSEGTPVKPLLVQSIDRRDRFYYLLRWQINGLDAAAVALDARFGIFLEGIAYQEPLRFIRLSPREVPRLLLQGLTEGERMEDVREQIIGRLMEGMDLRRPGALPGWGMHDLRRLLDFELDRLRRPPARLILRLEEIQVHPLAVWQPCAESLSMLYPFYLVTTPRRTYYVRLGDAAIFDRLRDLRWLQLGG